MTVNAITDTKKGEQGLRLLIFILPFGCLVLCILFSLSGEDFSTKIAPPLVIEIFVSVCPPLVNW